MTWTCPCLPGVPLDEARRWAFEDSRSVGAGLLCAMACNEPERLDKAGYERAVDTRDRLRGVGAVLGSEAWFGCVANWLVQDYTSNS